jgi:hypothetical protein
MFYQKLNIFFKYLVFVLTFFSIKSIFSQVCFGDSYTPTFGCSTLQMVNFTASENQQDFIFDSFSKWKSGITINGGTVIKVIAIQDAAPGATVCDWKLRMRVNSSGATGDEWETLDSYGSTGGVKPSVVNLQVRISNGCNSPQNSGSWQTFSGDMAIIDIVNPSPSNTTNLGNVSCGGETNGAGSYLGVDYNEFVFTIDYRIVPDVGFNLAPGRYEVKLDFCISQN